jgi:hypothetical protein
MHWPMQCICPDWNFRYDADPDQARRTRRAFLEACSDRGHIVLTSHFLLVGRNDHGASVIILVNGSSVAPRRGNCSGATARPRFALVYFTAMVILTEVEIGIARSWSGPAR